MVIGWFRSREPHPSNAPVLRLCLITGYYHLGNEDPIAFAFPFN